MRKITIEEEMTFGIVLKGRLTRGSRREGTAVEGIMMSAKERVGVRLCI